MCRVNETPWVFHVDVLNLLLRHLPSAATEWCGNPAWPGAVQLGFHLAFCCAQNEPLCGFLHRPRSEGNSEQRAPQRSRCLEISNQGNKWSTPETQISTIKETSVCTWSPHEGFYYFFFFSEGSMSYFHHSWSLSDKEKKRTWGRIGCCERPSWFQNSSYYLRLVAA